MKVSEQKPKTNAFRVWGVRDLPQERAPALYEITNGGSDPRRATFAKRKRQVIDLLRRGPVYCASPVRISDIVCILKHDHGFDIETETFPGNPTTGAGAYGIYNLKSRVRRINDAAKEGGK